MDLDKSVTDRTMDAIAQIDEYAKEARGRGISGPDLVDYLEHYRCAWKIKLLDEQRAEVRGAIATTAAIVRTLTSDDKHSDPVNGESARKIALTCMHVVSEVRQRFDRLHDGFEQAVKAILNGNEPDRSGFAMDPNLIEKQRLQSAMERYTIASSWNENFRDQPWEQQEYER